MFELSYWTSTMIGIFVLLFWSGSILAGARFFGGLKSGAIKLGVGPKVFVLNLNRFRYEICLLPISGIISIGASNRSKRPWLIPLFSSLISLCALAVALTVLTLVILGTGRSSEELAHGLLVRSVSPGSLAASAGIAAGDTLCTTSIEELSDHLMSSGQNTRLVVERDGVPREVTLQPSVTDNIIQPLGLKLVASSIAAPKQPVANTRRLNFALHGRPDHQYEREGSLVAWTAGVTLTWAFLMLVFVASHVAGTQTLATVILCSFLLWAGNPWYQAAFIGLLGILLDKQYPVSNAPFNPFSLLFALAALTVAIGHPVATAIVSHAARLRGVNLVWTL